MVGRPCHVARLACLAQLALGSALALLGASAKAEPLIERFDPAERGSRFFVADSLELDPQMRFATGLVASYGSRLRTFRQSGGDAEKSTLIRDSLWLHPGASLVLAPGARFAIDVPLALQSGEDVSLDKTLHGAPASPRFGDVKASFDVRLWGRERQGTDGATLAAGVSAYVPTGSADDYASDDFARVAVRIATSVARGPLLGAARLGIMYRKDELDPFAGVHLGTEANGVVAVGYRRGPMVVGPELHGSTTLKAAFERRNTPLEALLGAHVALGDLNLGGAVGTSVVNGLGAPRFRAVLSIEWVPAASLARDRDQDGVSDGDDLCPDVAGLASTQGCPPAPDDSDGDGIIDSEDACPQLPGVRSRDPQAHGCPDADHDGA